MLTKAEVAIREHITGRFKDLDMGVKHWSDLTKINYNALWRYVAGTGDRSLPTKGEIEILLTEMFNRGVITKAEKTILIGKINPAVKKKIK